MLQASQGHDGLGSLSLNIDTRFGERDVILPPTISLTDAKGPDGIRLYAIGDIHGCLGLLDRLLAKIEADIAEHASEDWRIIFLGDYVDRGSASKGVIDRLIQLKARDSRYITLAGNHDVEFLTFLREPYIGGVFVNCGGEATARSYGVKFDPARVENAAQLRKIHEKILAAIPDSHVSFLENLEFSVTFGDFLFCHAGIRPGIPLSEQNPDDLIWIRSPFLEWPSPLEKIIVHGHTISKRPKILMHRIGIDTGAYRSGCLTGIIVSDIEKRFIEA